MNQDKFKKEILEEFNEKFPYERKLPEILGELNSEKVVENSNRQLRNKLKYEFSLFLDKVIDRAINEERKRFLRSVNDKEKQEQILATLLLKIGNENEDIVIPDIDIITNDYVVFEKRDIENNSTIYKVVKQSFIQKNNYEPKQTKKRNIGGES